LWPFVRPNVTDTLPPISARNARISYSCGCGSLRAARAVHFTKGVDAYINKTFRLLSAEDKLASMFAMRRALYRAKRRLKVASVKVDGMRQGWGALWLWSLPAGVSYVQGYLA
jgi:hypothetical protein